MKKYLLLTIYIMCTWQMMPAQIRTQSEISRFQFIREGEDVLIQFEMNFSGRNLKSRDAWIIVPAIETERRILELPAYYITGNKMYRSLKRAFVLEKERYPIEPYRVVRAKELYGPLFYQVVVPYEAWMDEAELIIQRKEDCQCEDGSVNLQVISRNKMDIAAVQIAAPEPTVTETQQTPVVTQPSQKPEVISTGTTSLEGVAYLDFPFGQSYIVEHYANNEKELDEIKSSLNSILLNKNAEIKVIYLTGYSSIDGTYADNYQLSKRRTEALRDYIRERYDLQASLFILDWKGEDWSGLAKLVEPSGTPYKEAVLNIIEEIDIFDGREKKLMDLYGGSPYKYMQKHFFPLLRRVEYKIEYIVQE